MKSGQSRAAANKAIRQEGLRQKLINGGHLQHIIAIADQLGDLTKELEAVEIQRLKHTADIKLKLVDKYLPSLKSIEIEEGGKLEDIEDDELERRIKELTKSGAG